MSSVKWEDVVSQNRWEAKTPTSDSSAADGSFFCRHSCVAPSPRAEGLSRGELGEVGGEAVEGEESWF